MASIAPPKQKIVTERRFFLCLAIAVAAAVVVGFGMPIVRGKVRADALPVQVHLHALAFGGWIVLYVVQNALVDRGSVALHRRLGWFGAGLSAAMVPVGIVVTVKCIQRGAVPRFFPLNIFLVVNILGLLAFAGLVAAAIVLRRRPAWHRRLMLCAAADLAAPAFGRLLPMTALGPLGPLAITLSILAYPVAGMAFDRIAHRRIHPAWWPGTGAILAVQVLTGPIAFSPPVRALATRLAGG